MTQDEALKLARDALEALENISTALREDDVLGSDIELMLDAITTIRETLAQPDEDAIIIRYHEMTIKRLEKRIEELTAQPEQKPKICEANQQCLRGLPCMCVVLAPRPVAWGVDWGTAGEVPCVSITKRLPDGGIEVLAVEYGPPRKWVGLTRDEQGFVYDSLHNATSRKDSFWVDFATAIENKLKEKNA